MRYLPVRTRGSAAIAICGRCRKKVYYTDLIRDPNDHQFYCEDCVDDLDPYRKPAREPENITLSHPRPDEALDG